MPCAVRVCFWACEATAPVGLKWGLLEYAFPFEGNWNVSHLPIAVFVLILGIRFPVWRELKRRSNHSDWRRARFTWNTLSRLKGIETCAWRAFRSSLRVLEYAFPFEGNWNILQSCSWTLQYKLGIRFPVWRELKPIGSTFGGFPPCGLEYAFPFEGNWNEIGQYIRIGGGKICLEYAFPFEGNWNSLRLNRFIIVPFFVLEYAFPFEGNWNMDRFPVSVGLCHLGIRFPVWRELKQFDTDIP